ncbi:exonuclease SbcCD subunit D [Aquibacillus salsiterrae]|uniref:Nuclease SbcCD subunit D n=1 Tax=Aquibacillus salsiterrae TaxID=2950439 RepID=A0A9X3WB62_9BACI|nr:exonuclease SbcCD subunit D [Aquibacillus salsiterrae]MDC3415318.1 exonuclease SbcCD subunit D [Aquibacillus salsiterrae]
MKILHTADWHLGKIVNSVHMTEDQAYILAKFIQIIIDEKPDVVVIAGDLYDRAIPPKEAVDLLNQTLTTIVSDLEVPVLAIAGNHDSPDRLEFGNQLFRKQQLYLETKLKGELSPVTLYDDHGPVHFHLIPYIEPADARQFFGDEGIQSHQTAMEAVVKHIEQHHDMKERHVFVGHMFMAGGMESESEERLSMIGGTPYVDVNLFEKFTYVALGHLHQPQRIIKDTIRYSGSILKYSFSEANHKKSVTIVELDEQGNCQISQVMLMPRRDMRIVESYFNELLDGSTSEKSDDYLHVSLLDDGQLLDPMGKLRKKFPNILRLERKVLTSTMQLNDLNRIREKQKMTHTELFESFYKEMKGDDIPEERIGHMSKIVQALMEQERGK